MLQTNCFLCRSCQKTLLFAQQGDDPYLEVISEHLSNVPRIWYVCNECGFIYRSPILEDHEIARLYEFYEKDVFKSSSPDEYFNRIVNLPKTESENYKKTRWLIHHLRNLKGSKKLEKLNVLDVGCGGGTLLYTFAQHSESSSLFGVELNKKYFDLAQNRVKGKFLNKEYESGSFDRKFDLILCAKVLEHVQDPIEFVANLARDLKAGGFLFLEVPDIIDVFKLPPYHERFYIPHIYYFSQNTMTVVLHKANLEPLEIRSITTPRARSYLQIIAGHSNPINFYQKPNLPYDDPQKIISKVNSK